MRPCEFKSVHDTAFECAEVGEVWVRVVYEGSEGPYTARRWGCRRHADLAADRILAENDALVWALEYTQSQP